ncbi:MAG: bifunctional DNA primase/polymerase [Sphingomicrobium sp.]
MADELSLFSLFCDGTGGSRPGVNHSQYPCCRLYGDGNGMSFSEWQPRYSEHGIPIFPVHEKRPTVRGYLKAGLQASAQFATKFPTAQAFGLACRRSRIKVLDVDAPDERLLADAMSEVGPTPFVVRSGSGNYQAWYRHNGESRQVRPDPSQPIDILGDGFVVVPPSRGAKGSYTIVAGNLDDLADLPSMRRPSSAAPEIQHTNELVQPGHRNETLWRLCMLRARECRGISELMEVAMAYNANGLYEPLPDDEVLKVVASAWAKELSGNNWFGHGGRVVVDASQIDGLLNNDPDAFVLLTVLHRHHWGRDFVVANAMAKIMPGGGWRRHRLASARRHLIEAGEIEEISSASRHGGPARYRFMGGQK